MMPHIHEKYNFTVSLFIVQGQEVLFIFHKQLQRWLPVGGHIELDENPQQAALREAKEESGLDIELIGGNPSLGAEEGFVPLPTPIYMDVHRIKDPHWHIGLVYFAKVKEGQLKLNREEHEDIQWINEKDLNHPRWGLSVPLKFYAREAIQKVNNG